MAKKKKTGFDRVVTESPPGICTWEVGRLRFTWGAFPMLTLSVSERGSAERVVSYQKTLALAGTFAEGYAVGCGASAG